MSLIDRFVCRREGHVPSFVITQTSGVIVSEYITTCQRCGKVYAAEMKPSKTGVGSHRG